MPLRRNTKHCGKDNGCYEMNRNATGASTLAAMQADLVKTAFLPPAGGATAFIICK